MSKQEHDAELVELLARVARLTHPRARVERAVGFKIAKRELEIFAAARQYEDDWAIKVLNIFENGRLAHFERAAA